MVCMHVHTCEERCLFAQRKYKKGIYSHPLLALQLGMARDTLLTKV